MAPLRSDDNVMDLVGRGNPRRLGGIVLAVCAVFAAFMAAMFFILYPRTANPLPPFTTSVHNHLLVGGIVSCGLAVTLALGSGWLILRSKRHRRTSRHHESPTAGSSRGAGNDEIA
jgi:cytochrome c oxidase assembly factor CtaG